MQLTLHTNSILIIYVKHCFSNYKSFWQNRVLELVTEKYFANNNDEMKTIKKILKLCSVYGVHFKTFL